MNMIKTLVSTHELQNGDVIMNCGVYFLLSNRKDWPLTGDDSAERGHVVTLVGNPVGEFEGHNFPRHWLKDYSIQGNKLAMWCRITAD